MGPRSGVEGLPCDACGRGVTTDAAVIGFGGTNCRTCEEWASAQCLDCGGDLGGGRAGGACRCARDEPALASALADRGFGAFVEELGGGLLGVHVRLGGDRYAMSRSPTTVKVSPMTEAHGFPETNASTSPISIGRSASPIPMNNDPVQEPTRADGSEPSSERRRKRLRPRAARRACQCLATLERSAARRTC
jgi:hypothetical protein